MDKGIRSYVPCLLMLILLLGASLGNLIDDENGNLIQADHQQHQSTVIYLEWGR